MAASGWPRASAIGRRGVGALGPRSRWDRGYLIVWDGCVCDELFPPPRPGWEQPSFSHALMAVLCLGLCGLESRIQLFDMAARRILEASFEKSAVPSGPRAGPSSFTPLWRGRDINVEPGPPGAPDCEGPVSRCWERRRHVVSASQVQSTRKNSREERGLGRDRDTHQAMKPTRRRPVPHVPHQLSPSQPPCLAEEYGASTKLTEGCARACWITSRCQGSAHQ